MAAPEISDSVLGWLFVAGIGAAAVVRGVWFYMKKMSTVEVMPGAHNESHGRPITFDIGVILDIRDNVRTLAKIATEEAERKKQESHDRQLMDRWERMQARRKRQEERDEE